MSEPIPESIPTSADPRFKRPVKKRALSPHSQTATQINSLFSKIDQEIVIPPSSTSLTQYNIPEPPEIVQNVQGSSAGAGSGEFHVYKASRRREYERLRDMQAQTEKEREDEVWEKQKREREKRDREITRKKKEKRERLKQKRGKSVKKNKSDTLNESVSVLGNKLKPRLVGVEETNDTSSDVQTPIDSDEQRAEIIDEVGIIIHDDN